MLFSSDKENDQKTIGCGLEDWGLFHYEYISDVLNGYLSHATNLFLCDICFNFNTGLTCKLLPAHQADFWLLPGLKLDPGNFVGSLRADLLCSQTHYAFALTFFGAGRRKAPLHRGTSHSPVALHSPVCGSCRTAIFVYGFAAQLLFMRLHRTNSPVRGLAAQRQVCGSRRTAIFVCGIAAQMFSCGFTAQASLYAALPRSPLMCGLAARRYFMRLRRSNDRSSICSENKDWDSIGKLYFPKSKRIVSLALEVRTRQ